MLRSLEFIDRQVARAEYLLILLLTLFASVVMVSQVILRYLFSNPLFWAEEVSTIALVFITFFGLSHLLYRRELICLDFLKQKAPRPLRQWLEWVIDLCLLVVLVVFIYSSIVWITDPNTQTEYSATLNLPRWISYTVIPVSMTLMGLHQLVHMMRRIAGREE